jgi:hypothetical protein
MESAVFLVQLIIIASDVILLMSVQSVCLIMIFCLVVFKGVAYLSLLGVQQVD